ncbi:MAG: tetratricopeptide repeat protein [Candidatus Thiodiazotropha sp. (ex. Lucinisca nassula)]|nr:tetratricopeptide repeat protein [Candidatus Thiodiazotropha sp. (ex. Lucinisca nassula)]
MTSTFKYQVKAARCYRQGDYNEAIEQCKKMIEVEGDNAYSHYLIATCQELKEDYEEAILSAETALKCDKKHFDSLVILSRIYLNRNEHEKAREYVLRGLEAYPEPIPGPPKFFFTILKLLSIIPKFSRVYKQAEEEISNPNKSNEKWFQWAKEYLAWYERSKGGEPSPTVH